MDADVENRIGGIVVRAWYFGAALGMGVMAGAATIAPYMREFHPVYQVWPFSLQQDFALTAVCALGLSAIILYELHDTLSTLKEEEAAPTRVDA